MGGHVFCICNLDFKAVNNNAGEAGVLKKRIKSKELKPTGKGNYKVY